jgi:hypothetical protein
MLGVSASFVFEAFRTDLEWQSLAVIMAHGVHIVDGKIRNSRAKRIPGLVRDRASPKPSPKSIQDYV